MFPLSGLFFASNIFKTGLNCFSSQSVSKVSLSKLRKLTGFPFSVCKEALLRNNDNLEDAQNWLKEESVRRGWDKAQKLSGRSMSCGLLGLVDCKSKLLVVEANCETDFVARNNAFQNFVAITTEAIMNNCQFSHRSYWNWDDVSQISVPDSHTLKDKLSLTIGSIGENIQLRRAIGMSVSESDSNQYLAYYNHMSMDIKQSIRDVRFGKYAALIRYSSVDEKCATEKWRDNARMLGKQLCQHIVGMNPTPCLDPPEVPAKEAGDEKFILWQPFLIDEAVKVGDVLERNDMVLHDFVRIECGQLDEVVEVRDDSYKGESDATTVDSNEQLKRQTV